MQINNLVDQLLLEPMKKGCADCVVIVDSDQAYTYGEIFNDVKRYASSACFDTFKPGDIIACVLSSSIEAIIVFFALIYRGLVPCLINANLSLPNYIEYFKHATFSGLILPMERLEDFSKVAESFNIVALGCEQLADTEKSHQEMLCVTHDIAFCLYTSGTTGNPSLVFHRHQDPILMNKQYGQAVLNLCEQDVIVTTSQLYFAYGLNALFFCLLNRAKLIIPLKSITPELIWQQIERWQPTIFFSVPTMYKRLLQGISDNIKLSSLRLCVSAGENLPLTIFNTWQQYTGISILDGIGTTEVLSTFISNRQGKIKPGSTGYNVPGFITELRDIETNQPKKIGEVGVLWVKGETYVPYYPNNKTETENRFVEDWFKTNDLFSVDADGFYFYHGRANELIKVSGIWVYPYKIEQALTNHPAINEVVISGVQEADGLTRLVGYVVLNKGYLADEFLSSELQAWSKQYCAKHEYPHFIYFVNSIPKTATGKVKKFLLAEQINKELIHAN